MDDYDYLFKFILIGDSGVGKTNLLSRYVQGNFDFQSKTTIGVEFRTQTLNIRNYNVKLQIWDTAGQERYRAVTPGYYRGSVGVILVYDISNQTSFNNLSKWLNDIRTYTNDVNICLVGNKNDLHDCRVISTEGGENFAKQEGLSFIEVSALDQYNIHEAFELVTESIVIRMNNRKPDIFIRPPESTSSFSINQINTFDIQAKTKNTCFC